MHTALALSHESCSEWPRPPLVGPSDACHGPALPRPRPGSHQYNPFELLRCHQRRTAPDYQRLWRGEPAGSDLPRGYSQKSHFGLALAPVTPRQVQPPKLGLKRADLL
eukprot:scaffold45910_cov65-Phaeocystis_antarctica.AAC.1